MIKLHYLSQLGPPFPSNVVGRVWLGRLVNVSVCVCMYVQINKCHMNALAAIALLPLTIHRLVELCKTKSEDEPKGVSLCANFICYTKTP